MRRVGISVAALIISFYAHAEKCLDRTGVAAIQKDFKLIAAEGKLKLDLCHKDSLVYQTLQALLFLKSLPLSTLPVSDFNQNLMTTAPYQFFKDRVTTVVVDGRTTSDDCPDSRLAVVQPWYRETKKITVCLNFAHYDLVSQSSALVHEARHEEGPQYVHQICQSGPYQGGFSCDESYVEGGSYAIGLEFLVKLAKNPALASDLRERARTAAVTDFIMRFNRLPLDLKAGALLRDEISNNLTFFDGESEIATGLSVHPDTVITLRGGLPTFFESSQGTTWAYAYKDGPAPAAHDVLTDAFTSRLSRSEQEGLLDVVYANAFACLLLRSGLECYGPDRIPFHKDVTIFRARKFVVQKSSSAMDSEIVNILDDAGYIHRLPETADDLKVQDPAQWPRSTQPAAHIDSQPWDGGWISIANGGLLSVLPYRERNWKVMPGFKARQIRDVIAPFVWSERLSTF